LIPCRNEEAYIGACIESVLESASEPYTLELYVIDGMSEDRTPAIVKAIALRDPRVHLLSNPARITAAAMNIGTQAAGGDYILRIDAHAEINPNYILQCVRALEADLSIDVVGGVMVTIPRCDTWVGAIIAEALASPFGVGRSPFRTGTARAQLVSTVFCGCYRMETVSTLGLYNERLNRGEDFEYHVRLRAQGGRLMLIPSASVRYRARSQWGWPFVRYYFTEGFWAVYPSALLGNSYLCLSHLAPCFLVLVLTLSLGWALVSPVGVPVFLSILMLYVMPSLATAVALGVRRRSIPLVGVLPLVFATMHLPYGIGSIVAFIKRFCPSRARSVFGC